MATQVIPLDYKTPPFPSLYSPFRPLRGQAQYLFYTGDVLRFTLYWTLLFYAGAHLTAALCAVVLQWRSNWRKILWAAPLLYTVVAALQALLAGSVVGLVDRLGLVFEAGSFKMSTWIPFIWAVINTLVLILSSFTIQGGL
ncbi:hypothetical protein AJ80_02264 [Polytolypa hystricis UAMH7299]|uniref:Integral membrane protein n=1 Tax=Polytolypa hystricis (strain UAMH7299) TaxID=1447883 RepID=A0A2B7YRZ7_POLH7|nr:hypothetical protein AJ80_02264 [Polytolypa hystricis UAMH7299]